MNYKGRVGSEKEHIPKRPLLGVSQAEFALAVALDVEAASEVHVCVAPAVAALDISGSVLVLAARAIVSKRKHLGEAHACRAVERSEALGSAMRGRGTRWRRRVKHTLSSPLMSSQAS